MKSLRPILFRRGLMVIVLMLFIGVLSTQGQSDSTENELVFHVVKKQICEKVKPQTDLMREGLKGKVKTVVTEWYSDDWGNIETTGLFGGTKTSKNKIIGVPAIDVDTVVPRRKRTTKNRTETDHYDTTGTLTSSVSTSTENKHKDIFTRTRTFDKKHNIVSEISRSTWYYKMMDYQYDARGRLKAIRSQGNALSDGHSRRRLRIPFDYLCKYDSIGQCIESDMDNGHGRSFYTYDEIGNCIKKVDKPASGAYTTTLYSYGENCKVKEAIRTGHNKGRSSYEYDNKDSLIMQKDEDLKKTETAAKKVSLTEDTPIDNGTTIISYKYDDKGNKTEEKKVGITNGDSYEKSYKYLYDDEGNWIQKDEYISEQKTGYYIRKITYY